MAVVNSYFQKREKHRVTYKRRGKSKQDDYILFRECNLKKRKGSDRRMCSQTAFDGSSWS